MDESSSLRFFQGLYFSLNIIHLSANQRKEINDIIKKNGGNIVIGIPKETTHLVTGEKDIIDDSYRVKTAFAKGAKVVLPQYIFDCASFGQKLDEWKYFLIKGEDPTNFGASETDFVLKIVSEGLKNIQSILIETTLIEDSITNTLDQISGLCAGVLMSYDEEPYLNECSSLVNQMFEVIDSHPSMEERSDDIVPTVTSSLAPALPSFGKKLGEQQNSLASSIALRNKQKEERLQQQNLRIKQREDEKMKKEIDRKIREKEREMKIEQTRIKLEKERLKREEERAKTQRDMEIRSNQFNSQFKVNSSGSEIESEIDQEEVEKKRIEKMKEEEKERKKIIKDQKSKMKKEAMKIVYREKQEERKYKKEERLRVQKEEEEKKLKEKEIARVEYKQRHERKALKEMEKAKTPQKPAEPVVNDDSRKLFIGGVNFDDLKRLKKKLTADAEKEVKTQRVNNLFKIFEQFGTVEKKKKIL